jgi:hypothetical protein
MQLEFSDIYKKVSEHLGLGSSPTGTDLTKVKDLTYRGYRRFLTPINPLSGNIHIWTFLQQASSVTTTADTYEYSLEVGFSGFWGKPKLEGDSNYPNPVWVSEDQIRDMRTVDTSTNYPRFFSLRTGTYSVGAVAQLYTLMFYPTPDAAYVYEYTYIMEPAKPTSDTDLFVGGSRESEVILQCALAAAELQEDEEIGIQETTASRKLTELVLADLRRTPKSVGYMRDPSTLETRMGIMRDSYRIEDVDPDY